MKLIKITHLLNQPERFRDEVEIALSQITALQPTVTGSCVIWVQGGGSFETALSMASVKAVIDYNA